jgi:endonuclease G
VYTLTKAELAQNVNKTYFRIDKNVPTILQGNDTDYSNSGYDRGHLAPNNDFRFSKIAEYENMLYTNCAPQVPSFNRGVWATLESHVQDLVEKHGDAIIWTGCVYDGSIEICGNLPVPVYFWKLVYVDCKWYAWKMYNDDYSRAKFGDYTIDPFELLPLTQQ